MSLRDQVNSLTEEELAQFSDDELLQMQAELDKEESSAAAPSAPVVGKKETIGGTEFNVVEEQPGLMEKAGGAALGALQSLTFNMTDEAIAAYKTAKDVINDPINNISQVAAIYDKQKGEVDKVFGEIEKDVPTAYTTGQVLGGIGSAAISPYKKALDTLKGATAFGALSGFGEANLTKEGLGTAAAKTIGGGALGAAGFKAGQYIGSKLNAGKTAGLEAQKMSLESKQAGLIQQKAIALKDALGITGKTNKFLDLLNSRNHMTQEQFLQDVLDNVDVVNSANPMGLKDNLKTGLKTIWDTKLQPILMEIDNINPNGSIDVKNLAGRIIDEIKDSGSTLSIEQLESKLKTIVPSKPFLTMLEAQATMNSLDSFVGLTKSSRKVVDSAIRSSMLEAAEGMGGGLSESFKTAKRQYGNVAEASKFIGSVVNQFAKEESQWGRNTVNLKNMVSSIAEKINFAAPGKSAIAVGKALMGYNPKPQFEPIGRLGQIIEKGDVLAESIRKVGDKIAAEPGRYAKYAQRIGAAAGVSAEHFMSELGTAYSHMALEEMPLQRTSESINQNLPHLLNISKDANPQLHQALKQMIEVGDQEGINSVVNSVSRLPAFKGKIAPGIGIDGKIVDELDKKQVTDMVLSANSSNTQKAFALDQLNSTGVIPQLQPEIPFQVTRQLSKRNKAGKKESKF